MAASAGSLTRMCVEPGASPHTFDSSSEPYRFMEFGLSREGTMIDPSQIQGTRSHVSEQVRSGPTHNEGPIQLAPEPVVLDRWLERAMGGTKSGNTIALAETLPSFGVLAEYYSGKTIEYKDCKLDRLILQGKAHQRGQQPMPLLMSLEILGLSTAVDTSYPSVSLGTSLAYSPYTFCDLTTTQVSSSRVMRYFTLIIDNHLELLWGNGSCAPYEILEQDRTITLIVHVPFNSTNVDLYAQSAAGTTGTIVLTNSTVSCTLTFGVLQAPVIGPKITHKGEVLLPIIYTARQVSTTKELVATNDSTP